MKKLHLLLFILFTISVADTLYIRPPQSKDDISHDYYKNLLQLILNKTEKEYGKSVVLSSSKNMTQKRALIELQIGHHIDIDWAGTTKEREKSLGTIRIPLCKGLLGYRVPVIRSEDTTLFNKRTSLDSLKKYPCIQGSQWPDSDILESAGLQVIRTPQFKSMYPMLLAKRGDWFPRGINEVYAEVSSVGKEVIAFDKLIVAYPFPMYFFVQKEREALRNRIEKGLRKALADGSFDTYMRNHSVFSSVFPLERLKESTIIHLNNPYLSKETPLEDETLWLKIGE